MTGSYFSITNIYFAYEADMMNKRTGSKVELRVFLGELPSSRFGEYLGTVIDVKGIVITVDEVLGSCPTIAYMLKC